MNYEVKTISVLGSTGCVGKQAIEVSLEMGLSFRLLAAANSVDALAEQAIALKPECCCIINEKYYGELKERLAGNNITVIAGEKQLVEYLASNPADITVQSIAGLAALPSTMAAAASGTRLAMANKEAIISAGALINEAMRASGAQLIPVDSEHSAIFQCLDGHKENVERLLLTASGGPFFGKRIDELESVTPAQALAHPTWKMGPKITVDSATMMNKGFEIIEAARLFNVKSSQIEVVIHRESIIHSMVEYTDKVVMAQLGLPDMRDCVRYAISYPSRSVKGGERLDLAKLGKLTFFSPDEENFPLLRSARAALETDGAAPTALIAADEAAVEAFLGGKIGFCDIYRVVDETMSRYCGGKIESLDDAIGYSEEYRALARRIIDGSIERRNTK